MNKIIGLTGFKGSGKDTVAAILKEAGYRISDDADFIRQAWDGLTCTQSPYRIDHVLKEMPHPNLGISYRRFATAYGDFADTAFPEAGSLSLAFSLAKIMQGGKICMSNIRRQSQLDLCKRFNGEVWWIERPRNPFQEEGNTHETERDYSSQADVIIPNDGTFKQLLRVVRKRI